MLLYKKMIKRSFEDTRTILVNGCGSWYSNVERLVRAEMDSDKLRNNCLNTRLYHYYYERGMSLLENGCGIVWAERRDGKGHFWKNVRNYNKTDLFMVCGVRGWMYICASLILRKCCTDMDEGHARRLAIEKAQLMELERVLGLKW